MRVCTKCGRTSEIHVDVCPACKGVLITAVDAATDGSAALQIDPDEELAPGTMVGDYKIEKRIGFGGMGIVYGAQHPVIGKRAAVKVLNARYCADQEAVRRFVREAQAVNQIAHANIVDIFAIGELDDGRSYFVMEWLQGETLMDRMERKPLSQKDTIAILIALTRALQAAHTAGVVHRDLKPENIILVPEDESFRVKLLDFGIAKLQTRRAPTGKTATGMTVGTPLYMSPEQAKGIAIDGRSDIYSLGILAYAMVCRTTPFEKEESPVEVLHAHISKKPKPPSEIVPELSPLLDTLILQMIAKKPEERPAIVEVRQRLKAIDSGSFETFSTVTPMPHSARPAELHPATIKTPRRRSWRVPLIAIGVAAAALVTVAALSAFDDGDAQEPIVVKEEAPPKVADRIETPATPPPVAMGTIELSVEPAGATVLFDTKPITLDRGRIRLETQAGDHVVAVSANGYRTVEQSVAVTSSQVTPLAVRLVKVKARTVTKKKPKDVDAVVDPFRRKKSK
jgi:serine/threonine protein kinase